MKYPILTPRCSHLVAAGSLVARKMACFEELHSLCHPSVGGYVWKRFVDPSRYSLVFCAPSDEFGKTSPHAYGLSDNPGAAIPAEEVEAYLLDRMVMAIAVEYAATVKVSTGDGGTFYVFDAAQREGLRVQAERRAATLASAPNGGA